MKLHKFIKQNFEDLSSEEPLAGHFDRFNGRMDRFYAKRRHEFRMNLLKIAALAVFVFLATTVFVNEYRSFKAQADLINNDNENNELAEAELYYSDLLSDYYNRISHLNFSYDEQEKDQVLKELKEMDQQVEVMKNDLRENPDNEIIISAIISHYQIQLELMDNIIAHVEKTDNSLL